MVRIPDWLGAQKHSGPLYVRLVTVVQSPSRTEIADLPAVRVDRWNGSDIDVEAPLPSDLILTAAEVRPEIMQHAGGYLSMAALPASLRGAEPMARDVYAGGWRPSYAPGPTRDELVEIVGDALREPQPA